MSFMIPGIDVYAKDSKRLDFFLHRLIAGCFHRIGRGNYNLSNLKLHKVLQNYHQGF